MKGSLGAASMSPGTAFALGPVEVSYTVVYTWAVMAVISLIAYLLTRRLSLKPTAMQGALEASVEAIENTIKDALPIDPWLVIPVIGTLWILIGFSNLAGLIPGVGTPTADINTTAALAAISFSMTHVYGFYTRGFAGHLRHYAEPTWVLVPFLLMAEATRTVALALRLFGNMISGEMIAIIILGIAGLIVPVAFDLLHIVIGLIQAYIFGVLTLVFIAEGVEQGAGKGE